MSFVYLAHDPQLDRDVALKLMRVRVGDRGSAPPAARGAGARAAFAPERRPRLRRGHGRRAGLRRHGVREGPDAAEVAAVAEAAVAGSRRRAVDAGRGLAAAHAARPHPPRFQAGQRPHRRRRARARARLRPRAPAPGCSTARIPPLDSVPRLDASFVARAAAMAEPGVDRRAHHPRRPAHRDARRTWRPSSAAAIRSTSARTSSPSGSCSTRGSSGARPIRCSPRRDMRMHAARRRR